MNKFKGTTLFEFMRRGIGVREAAVAIAIVVLAFHLLPPRLVAASRTVSVTATMGNFSPNPDLVEVNTSATSQCSAQISNDYNPPVPAPDEGTLVDSYTWSYTVQFKATWLNNTGKVGAYGAPPNPALDYSTSFSPNSNAQSGSTTLTFTPKIAGYWQISVACDVTVTDTKDPTQPWTGSANAGPQTLTSYILHITYGGNVVDGNTEFDSVGDHEALTANYGPSDMALQWTVKGSIIAEYTVTNSGPTYADIDHTKPSVATITPVTPAELQATPLEFYWMDTDSSKTQNEEVTLGGKLPNGQNPPAVSTTFNVYRPSQYFFQGQVPTSSDVMMTVAGTTAMVYDDDEPAEIPGINFVYFFLDSPGGNCSQAQINTGTTVFTDQYNTSTGVTTTFSWIVPSSSLPGPLLDTQFPYVNDAVDDENPKDDSDSPDYPIPPPAGTGFGAGPWQTRRVELAEGFINDLLWTPPDAGATYAPVAQIEWSWGFDVLNPNDGGYQLANWAKNPSPGGYANSSDLSRLPEWNNNLLPALNDPKWSP